MKVGFFGTPDIAAHCLDELAQVHDIAFVVTPCDKPAGRHQHMQCCPAKDAATCLDVPILQPDRLRCEEFVQEVQAIPADIYVVVAYGKLIPKEIFDFPPLKTINLHPSLLPKYRGAAPIPWAIINGEKKTGVTVQLINERMDAGDIVVQEEIPLDENITTGELYDLVLPMGGRLLNEAIQGLASGSITPVAQNEEEATWCGKITRETAQIDWERPAWEIHNLVRGLNPRPAAWSTFREKNIRIFKAARLSAEFSDVPPLGAGEFARYRKKHLLVGTGSEPLEVLELQMENKKKMDGPSFINGARLERGEHCY